MKYRYNVNIRHIPQNADITCGKHSTYTATERVSVKNFHITPQQSHDKLKKSPLTHHRAKMSGKHRHYPHNGAKTCGKHRHYSTTELGNEEKIATIPKQCYDLWKTSNVPRNSARRIGRLRSLFVTMLHMSHTTVPN